MAIPYPLFRRLAFFAAAQHNVHTPSPCARLVAWQMSTGGCGQWKPNAKPCVCWLHWHRNSMRRCSRSLNRRSSPDHPAPCSRTISSPSAGPDRGPGDLAATGKDRRDRRSPGCSWPNGWTNSPPSIREWKLAADQRDEFPYWMDDGDECAKVRRHAASSPRVDRMAQDSILHWTTGRRTTGGSVAATTSLQPPVPCAHWPEKASGRPTAGATHYRLGRTKSCSSARGATWRRCLVNAPDELLQSLAHGVSGWLQTIAKTFEGHDAVFLDLCSRRVGAGV